MHQDFCNKQLYCFCQTTEAQQSTGLLQSRTTHGIFGCVFATKRSNVCARNANRRKRDPSICHEGLTMKVTDIRKLHANCLHLVHFNISRPGNPARNVLFGMLVPGALYHHSEYMRIKHEQSCGSQPHQPSPGQRAREDAPREMTDRQVLRNETFSSEATQTQHIILTLFEGRVPKFVLIC